MLLRERRNFLIASLIQYIQLSYMCCFTCFVIIFLGFFSLISTILNGLVSTILKTLCFTFLFPALQKQQ